MVYQRFFTTAPLSDRESEPGVGEISAFSSDSSDSSALGAILSVSGSGRGGSGHLAARTEFSLLAPLAPEIGPK